MSPGIINAISSQDIFCESSSILCLDFFVSSTIPMTGDQGILHGTDPIKGSCVSSVRQDAEQEKEENKSH